MLGEESDVRFQMKHLRLLAMIELAIGIFLTPFFMNLLVSVVHVSLALTWVVVVVAERILIRVGWLPDNGMHDKVRLSNHEKSVFEELVGNYHQADH